MFGSVLPTLVDAEPLKQHEVVIQARDSEHTGHESLTLVGDPPIWQCLLVPVRLVISLLYILADLSE